MSSVITAPFPVQAIVYEHLEGLAEAVRLLAADPAFVLLRVKNRFAPPSAGGAGPGAGGYRDVAAHVRLAGPDAEAVGADRHVCELQLLLLTVARRRSEDGHRRYIAYRNAVGS